MESIFPGLFFLSYFVPTLLRVVVGVLFLISGWKLLKSHAHDKLAGAGFSVIGILLVIGLFTQLAAIGGIIHILLARYLGLQTKFSSSSAGILALIILVSLVFTGAGALAIDLPY